MRYGITTATKKILKLTKRIRAVSGGTAASKTVSILLALISYAQQDESPTVTSVVSESLPHLKRGAMRDFLNIMQSTGRYEDAHWNRTDFIYTFGNGSKIEFFGADQPDKVRGPRRDRLFINEANNVPFTVFDQLEVRTSQFVYLDWNPVSEFWFYTELLPARAGDIDLITLTYLDNEAIDPKVKASIEARKDRKLWWRVFGEGQLGEHEGRIYTGWKIIEEIPHEARLLRYGLDFGYANHPTAIVAVYYHDGGYIWDEVAYQRGLTNRQIADILLNVSPALVRADSAEPKSIDEIKSYGVNILPCEKKPGSVNYGIQIIQGERISVTARSTNILREYRNYLWEVDKDGRVTNNPEEGFNHAMDAGRYAMEGLTVAPREFKVVHYRRRVF